MFVLVISFVPSVVDAQNASGILNSMPVALSDEKDMTRNREKVSNANLVGVWSILGLKTKYDTYRTNGFIWLHDDGRLVLRGPNCRLWSEARWELDKGIFVITEQDGEKWERPVMAVPSRNDGYGRMMHGNGQVWERMSRKTDSKC